MSAPAGHRGSHPFDPRPDITTHAADPRLLTRRGARILPADGAGAEKATVYVGAHLLVRNARAGQPAYDALVHAAAQHGMTVEVDPAHEALHAYAAAENIDGYPDPVSLVRLRPTSAAASGAD